MSIRGHFQNGVVVLDEAVSLPDGTRVRVEPLPALTSKSACSVSWEEALRAAHELENYDFEAWRKQREFDLQHARDLLP